MSYSDPRPDMEGHRQRPMGASPRQAGWSWVFAVALVVVLGLTFYGINARYEGQKVANPPAVTAAPAPATGVAPPTPQTTTGQAAPSATPETTGRGAASQPATR